MSGTRFIYVKGIRAIALSGLLWLAMGCWMSCTYTRANVVSPLAISGYQTRALCAAPDPGRARCLGFELVPRSAAARARETPLGMSRTGAIGAAIAGEGAYGLRPQDLQSAYFPDHAPDASSSEMQTIAIVDAYNDPDAEAALAAYDQEFSLSQCTAADGCFEQVNQKGEAINLPFPQNEQAIKALQERCESTTTEPNARAAACREVQEVDGWAREVSINIEVAHAICQNCHIRLVEATLPQLEDLEDAERTAARAQSEGGLGAEEISNSWGVPEPALDSEAFNHPGVVITAAAGDFGYLNWTEAQAAKAHSETYYSGVEYPASSPHVIAVGGTKLLLGTAGARQSETVWNEDPNPTTGSGGVDGGGCSLHFNAPSWQQQLIDWSAVGCGVGAQSRRAVADVAADGDPYTGVAIYYGEPDGQGSWRTLGGTSVASSIIAAMFALAGGSHGVAYPAQTLYEHLGSPALYDVSEGGDGRCDGNYSSGCAGSMNPLSPFDCGAGVLICNAGVGYDGPSGVGAPDGLAAFVPNGIEVPGEQDSKTQTSSPPTQQVSGQTLGSSPGAPSGLLHRHTHRSRPRILNLELSRGALSALTHGKPAVRLVAFAYTLSVPTLVRVGLYKRVYRDGRWRWQVLPDALTIAGKRARDHAHLKAPGRLAPGLYRLRLRPVGGSPRSMLITVG